MVEQLIETISKDINGFGDDVVKIIDHHGKVICYIGKYHNDPQELIHFPNPLPIDLICAIQEILEKRKIRNNEKIKKSNEIRRQFLKHKEIK